MCKDEAKQERHISLKNYLLAFSIPVLLVGLLLWWNESWYAHQKAEIMHTATLNQVADSIDMIKEHCDAIAYSAQNQPGLVNALKEGSQPEYISRWIGAYQEMSEFSVYMALYQRGSQSIYLADGLVPYSVFEANLDSLSASMAGLYGKLNKISTQRSVTLYRTAEDPYCIAYLYSLMDDSAKIVGTLCIAVPSSVIKEIYSRFFNAKTAGLVVLDAANNPLFVEPRQWALLKELRGLQGTGVSSLSDRRTIALRIVSSGSQQSYYICMSATEFYQWGTMQVLIYPMIALCVLSAMLFAVLFFRSHQRYLNAMDRKNNDLSNKLDEHAQIIRNLVLRKLVDGSISDENLIQYNLRCANLTLNKPLFMIAVFLLLPETDTEAVQKAASQICKNLETDEAIYYCFDRFEYSQLILLANFETEHGQNTVIQTVKYLADRTEIPCTCVGVGRPRHNLQKLSHALVEALVAIHENLNPQDQFIYLFMPLQQENRIYNQFTIEKSLIHQSLRSGNQTMLHTSIRKLFSHLSCSNSSDAVLQCAYYDIVNFCISLGEEFGHSLSDETIAELSNFQTANALEEQVIEVLEELCVHAKAQMIEHLNAPKHNLLNYVQAHFRDPSLSLTTISDELNLTQSYISKLFKEETGQTFISYVRELRIGYAKRELMETNRPIKDIIADSGYIDAASFSRTFKAMENMTPSEYRAHMQSTMREASGNET